MQVKVSPVYLANYFYLQRYKIILHQGGTRSGKTYNTVNYLIDSCLQRKGLQVTIVSMNVPHLTKGAIKDFLEIIKKREIYSSKRWSETKKVYKFKNGSYIEFFSVDNEAKARGSHRDILFINEGNKGILLDTYKQLLIRTRESVIIDYNPSEPQHWIYDEVVNREDCKLIISTYLDNYDFLPDSLIFEIERMKEVDPAYWRVFGEGQRGMALEGQVFKGWTEIEDSKIPKTRKVFGLDFGFSNDPTALVECSKVGEKIYLKELIYETGLNTNNLILKLKSLKVTRNDIIIADSASQDAIDILRTAGFLVYSAKKGDGSIKIGIDYIKQHKVLYSHKSPNIALEYNFYTYRKDTRKDRFTDGFTNIPNDTRNHLMDAFRYACEEYRGLHGGGGMGRSLNK